MKNHSHQNSFMNTFTGFEPVIIANDRKNFIRHSNIHDPAVFSRQIFMKLCTLPVIDKESLKMIQVLRLHEVIDHTESITGSVTLLRSLIQPSTDCCYIQSKQESLHEIAANDRLRQNLKDFLSEYAQGESRLFKYFNKDIVALFPYSDIKKARKAAVNIVKILETMPKPESPFLNALLSYLQVYKDSPMFEMMNGAVYKTFSGLKSSKEVGLFTPKQKFVPRRFTKWFLTGPAIFSVPYIWNRAGFDIVLSPALSSIGLALTGLCLFYSLFIKPVKDTGEFIEPLRKTCIHDPAFSRAVDAVGMIDELLSFDAFAKEFPDDTVIPIVTDQDHHSFEASGLKSPVLMKYQKHVIPNDICMNGARLTFISGPNSGGKTTVCKSIVHNQLLAQIGCYVTAESASINIADMISYQAPKFDGLLDEEGRFGTELSRTRDIFYSTTPKSLVILDELAEGTTFEERLHESFEILHDFYTIGGNTILVTHNHSLADRFMKEQQGQSLMVEVKGDQPTYKLIPGISKVSHADRIAKKIQFSKEDRHRYMKEKGYLRED